MFTQNRVPFPSAFRRSSLAALLTGLLALSASGKNKGDIGSPKPEGKSVQRGDVWEITAGGADIFGPSDQFHFVSNSASGNCTLTAKIVSVGESGCQDWAKAGLMIRADESVGSPHATVAISHAGTIAFLIRNT